MRSERITMNQPAYFHITANGADARHFITCEAEYFAAFNLIGVCAANCPGVTIVSFSIEDSHPHMLVWGIREDCAFFKDRYETLYKHFVAATRKGGTGLVLHCELYPIGDDPDYLLNVAVYTIIQPTKDGKPVMYHDYPWGTGNAFFKVGRTQGRRLDSFSGRARMRLLHSEQKLPPDWIVGEEGYILPESYVNVERVESLFRTPKRMNYFLQNSSKAKRRLAAAECPSFSDQLVLSAIHDLCHSLFRKSSLETMDWKERAELIKQLRYRFSSDPQQLARVTGLSYETVTAMLDEM